MSPVGEAVPIHEAGTGEVLPRPAPLPGFGVAKRRSAVRREVAVRLASRFPGWIVGHGRPCRASARIWCLDDMLPIHPGLSHEAARRKPPGPLTDAERRVAELAREPHRSRRMTRAAHGARVEGRDPRACIIDTETAAMTVTNATSEHRQAARATGGRDPYLIPRPAVISFSGGRTSGYMLKHIVEAYGGALPDGVAAVFANTGMEHPATLDFVDACARAWGVRVVWVEYDWDAPRRTRIVDYRSASRNGEPYAALIGRKGFVPNVGLRFCTGDLKRDRIESYARYRLGLRRWRSVVGLRADERSRVLRMRARDCGSRTGAHAALPLADAGVAERDVLAWWKRQPFDLGIPSAAGNCTLCYLKGRGKLLRLIREDPSRADWWIAQERRVSNRTGPDGKRCESMKRFRFGETYEELRAAALGQGDLFDDPAAGGDTFDCHCTD